MLNLDAARRQAIGRDAQRPRTPKDDFELLSQEILRLPPHADFENWNIDEWDANPFQDRNWQFQLHTLRFLNPVRYLAIDGDAEAKAFWLRVANSWVRFNGNPTSASSTWAWKDMTDGLRATQLALGAPIIQELEGEPEWYIDTLRQHRDWLMDSSKAVKRNHGMHQLQGLFVVGAVMNDQDAMLSARDRLLSLFDSTFDSQGVDDEGAPAYMIHNLRWWREVLSRFDAESIDVPEIYSATLKKTEDAIWQLQQPDGLLPQIGDTPRNSGVTSIRTVAPHNDKALLTRVTLDAGYTVFRSDDRTSYTLVRHGEVVEGHSHNDKGSVLMHAKGRLWWADAGFWSYNTKDPMRTYTKSRYAHNLPLIKGIEDVGISKADVIQEISSPIGHSIWTVDESSFSDTALFRNVIFLKEPEVWVVLDAALSPNGTQLAHNWLVAEGVNISSSHKDNSSIIELSDETNTLVMNWPTFLGQNDQIVANIKRTEIALNWKTKVDSSRVEATAGNDQPLVMLATFHKELNTVKLEAKDEYLVLSFRIGELQYQLSIPIAPSLLEGRALSNETKREVRSSSLRPFVFKQLPQTVNEIPRIAFRDLDQLRDMVTNTAPFKFLAVMDHCVIPVNIKISSKFSERLLVTYNGSVDRIRSPHGITFQRSRWLRDFPATTVQFADPTLLQDAHLSEGWGQLSREHWAIDSYWTLLERLRGVLSLPDHDRTLHYGSSAGGFQALATATYDQGSYALVNNPQLDWSRFHPRSIEKITRNVYGMVSVDELIKVFPWRVSILQLFRRMSHVPDTTLMINISSFSDYCDQLKPFIFELDSLINVFNSSNIKVELYKDDALGHNPLSKDDTIHKINGIFWSLEKSKGEDF